MPDAGMLVLAESFKSLAASYTIGDNKTVVAGRRVLLNSGVRLTIQATSNLTVI